MNPSGAIAQVIIVDTIRSTLIFLLVSASLALAQSPLEQAVTLAREKRYAEARKLLDGVPEPSAVAQRIAFHRLKAAVASGLGDAAIAADEMRAALALAPADAGLRLATAAAELQAGRLDDALDHARSASGTAVGEALLGDIYERRGEFVAAVKAYQQSVALAPDREQYRIALALELVQHYTLEPAITVLQDAAPRFPKSARLRTLLGVAQYAAGRNEDALASLTDAAELDPQLAPVYTYLAQAALQSPSTPSDRTMQVVCAHDAVVCAALRSRAAIAMGDAPAEARAIAELQGAPANNAIARCELGRIYQTRERWNDARGELESCVRLDATPQNHYRLGQVYTRLGLSDLAKKEMDLRRAAEQQAAESNARRENAVQTFRYLMK